MGSPGRYRGVRASAACDHRPRHGPAADDGRRGQLDHVQRRDLQLPRAADSCSACDASARARDTEVDPARLRRWGDDCLEHLRGMFAFALWDERAQTLFCARDRFGIKPFYYAQVVDDGFCFASETKALLPFLPAIETDLEGFKDYLAFQFCLARQDARSRESASCRPATSCASRTAGRGEALLGRLLRPRLRSHGPYFEDAHRGAASTSRSRLHLRADVPVGAYLSGGLDSSIVAMLAAGEQARL